MAVSKNQRKASVPGSTGGFTIPGDSRLVVPLGAGHCYLLDPANGNNLHLKVGSPESIEHISRVFATSFGPSLRKQIVFQASRFPDVPWLALLAAIEAPEVIEEVAAEEVATA